ncbi:MAG: hypothetical protein ICV80_00105 [Microcoleus sp. T1-bin1]|nr:hypothetical protein [Microcoleus sp. T1-bin1]MBD0340871.1 hypothetical protein [Microcoleus sp. Co-bin12]
MNASKNGESERAERLLEAIYTNDLQNSASPNEQQRKVWESSQPFIKVGHLNPQR